MVEKNKIIIVEGRRAVGKTTFVQYAAKTFPSTIETFKWGLTEIFEWTKIHEKISFLNTKPDAGKIFLIDRFHLTEAVMRMVDYCTGKYGGNKIASQVYHPETILLNLSLAMTRLENIGARTIYLQCLESVRRKRLIGLGRMDEEPKRLLTTFWALFGNNADYVVDTGEPTAKNDFLEIIKEIRRN